MNKDKALGALIGAACGDSAGTSQEFSHPSDRKPFPELNLGPQTDIVGGGPFRLQPGQVTDDTMLGAALAQSLIEQGHYNREDTLRRYARWRGVTFDIGGTTSGGISRSLQHGPHRGGFEVWKERGDRCAANGSLMKIYPIGVFYRNSPLACRIASLQDSGITHAHPLCLAACAAFNRAIGGVIYKPMRGVLGMFDAAYDELELLAGNALPYLRVAFGPEIATQLKPYFREAATTLLEDLVAARDSDDPLQLRGLDMYGAQGYVRVAWTLAWWELFYAPDFESGVLDVANRGGDSDSNGSVAGALLGAYYGAGAIPGGWKNKVLGALQDGPASLLRDEFHPKVFPNLVEVLSGETRSEAEA